MDLNKSFITSRPIAHRGLHNDSFPENSYLAFENAIINNYPIEIDVRFTKDEKVVVFHDDSLLRMCGINKDVSDCEYSEVSNYYLGNSKEKIPLFSDLLDFVLGKVPLLIEIKTQKIKGIEQKIASILKGYEGEFALQSFDPYVLMNFKKILPTALRGQLSCSFKNSKMSFFKKLILKYMLLNIKSKPHFISYCIDDLPSYRINSKKKVVVCWTVNTIERLEKAKKLGINVIFESVNPK